MNRNLKIGVHDQEPRIFNRIKAALESQINRLASVQICTIKSLTDSIENLDLLLIVAPPLNGESFTKWLNSIESRCSNPESIWTPCLIIADIDFVDLNELLAPASKTNWYFDIVHSQHLNSLPIRVANLLRIADHLKELLRYDREVKNLLKRVEFLEAKFQSENGKKTNGN
jgi:hypothetical protein